MANQKISELTALLGSNVADDDALAIVDTSTTETKKIVFSELESALDTSTGFVRIIGDTMTGDLSFGDNDKAIFGAGSDLQIYHNGSDSYIDDTGTGALILRGNSNVTIGKYTGETMGFFEADGAVSLYHNNAIKLATTATGIDVTGTVTADGLDVAYNLPDDTHGVIRPLKLRTTDTGNQTNLLAGDGVGILFEIPDQSSGSIGASIDAVKESNTDDNTSTALSFKVSNNDETLDEAMVVDSSGSLRLGTTSNEGISNQFTIKYGGGGTEYGMVMKPVADTTVPIYFQNASGGGVGSISITASATAYNTSSDYRLKENVTDVTDGITRVKQLAPKRFNFIADADTTVDGFLAHEAQAVVPEAVIGTHNEVDDDGNAVMQGIDQSKLVPLLTAALQEAISKIETLETKVAVLEGA